MKKMEREEQNERDEGNVTSFGFCSEGVLFGEKVIFFFLVWGVGLKGMERGFCMAR